MVYRHCSFLTMNYTGPHNLEQLNTNVSEMSYQLIYGIYYTNVHHMFGPKSMKVGGEANRPAKYVHS